MAKKIIRLTEADLRNIVSKVITEQSEERKFTKILQKFLNKKYPDLKLVEDGKTGAGSQTEKAIQRYQRDLGVYPQDGVWGPETANKMPSSDLKTLKKISAEEGDIFDKLIHWLGLD